VTSVKLWLKATCTLLIAAACQSSGVATTTAAVAAASAGWVCQACVPISPAGGSGPTSTGGRNSTGGSSTGPIATGGAKNTGGRAATGGLVGAGGTTQSCTVVQWPTQANATPEAAKMAKRHRLHPRHKRHPGRAPATAEQAAQCSVAHMPNCPTLDQGDTGSCTGNAHVMAISTQPFTGSAHCNQTDARTAYQGGTCIDNDCSIPCTCTSCSKAFCPNSGSNDVGSYTGSVAQWMVDVGWLRSFTTADTLSTLQSCLARGPAVIGVDWYNSMFTPSPTGQLVVTKSSGIAGGHDINAAMLDVPNQRVWVHNSWGDSWGWCLAIPDGSRECGYAWIALSDLPKLNFDGDCPTP
jgi:hypothetical protein